MKTEKTFAPSKEQIKRIDELAALMAKHNLETLHLEIEGMELGLSRPKPEQVFVSAPAKELPKEADPAPETEEPQDLITVPSPMVGIFYTAPSPEAPPFVTMGQEVKAGDVLCIIEAMKLMNEITAEEGGIVTQCCPGNGQLVEFGQPLFKLRRKKWRERR